MIFGRYDDVAFFKLKFKITSVVLLFEMRFFNRLSKIRQQLIYMSR